jgi:hypothetical protein
MESKPFSFQLEHYEGIKIFLQNRSVSKVLSNSLCFVIAGSGIVIYSHSIYCISRKNNCVSVYCKINDENGKSIVRKYFFGNEIFFEIFLLFFEHEIFRKQILKIIGVIQDCLKSKNELGKIFEELMLFNKSKIDSIKKQDFEKAASFRDDEQKAIEKTRQQLKELFGGGFEEIIDYLLLSPNNLIDILEKETEIS